MPAGLSFVHVKRLISALTTLSLGNSHCCKR